MFGNVQAGDTDGIREDVALDGGAVSIAQREDLLLIFCSRRFRAAELNRSSLVRKKGHDQPMGRKKTRTVFVTYTCRASTTTYPKVGGSGVDLDLRT